MQELTPSIRFPEFKGSWKHTKLGKIATFHKGKGITKADVEENGRTKCIRYGELYTHYSEQVEEIKSSTNLSPDSLFLSEGNDVLIPASGESAIDMATATCVKEKGVALGGDINVIRSDLDGSFLAYYLNNTKKVDIARSAQGISVIHLYAAQLKLLKMELPPTKNEAKKLGSFFSLIDKKISLLKEKHALLTQYKKGVIQKLFKQEIRFKDDNGDEYSDWQEYRLSDVLELTLNPIKMADELEYELITVRRRSGGVDSRGFYKGKEVLVKSQFALKKDQFVISKRQIVHGAFGIVPCNLEGAIVSNEYNVFDVVPDLLDVHFFNLFSQTKYMRRAYFINSDGVHIEKLLFKTQSWLKTKVTIPSLSEQKKIVAFVGSLDEKLVAINKQIELTQTFKKGLLQQMFV